MIAFFPISGYPGERDPSSLRRIRHVAHMHLLCRLAAAAASRCGRQQILRELGQLDSPAAIPPLRGFLEKETDQGLKGQASLALAKCLQVGYERAYNAKDKKADMLAQEAEALLTKVEKEHPGLKSQAADALFILQKLSVGKPAMEIEGEDIDGKKFKLSDYRGKVVFLDFWGHW
jgi:HEAT repeat protein